MLTQYNGETDEQFAQREQETRYSMLMNELLHFAAGRSEQDWQEIASLIGMNAPDVAQILNDAAYEQGSRDANAAHNRK